MFVVSFTFFFFFEIIFFVLSSLFYFCGFVIIGNLNENTHLLSLSLARARTHSRIQGDHKSWEYKRLWLYVKHRNTHRMYVSIVVERPVETALLSKYSTDCSMHACSLALVHSTLFLFSFYIGLALRCRRAGQKRPFRRRCGELRCMGIGSFTANNHFWAHTEMVCLALSKWRYKHF